MEREFYGRKYSIIYSTKSGQRTNISSEEDCVSKKTGIIMALRTPAADTARHSSSGQDEYDAYQGSGGQIRRPHPLIQQ